MAEVALKAEKVNGVLRLVGRWEVTCPAVEVSGRDVSHSVERARFETVHCPVDLGCGTDCQRAAECWHRVRNLQLGGDVRVLAPLFDAGRVLVAVADDSMAEPFEFAVDGALLADAQTPETGTELKWHEGGGVTVPPGAGPSPSELWAIPTNEGRVSTARRY